MKSIQVSFPRQRARERKVENESHGDKRKTSETTAPQNEKWEVGKVVLFTFFQQRLEQRVWAINASSLRSARSFKVGWQRAKYGEMWRAVINSTRLNSVNWLKILSLMDAQGEKKKITPEPSKHSLQLIIMLFWWYHCYLLAGLCLTNSVLWPWVWRLWFWEYVVWIFGNLLLNWIELFLFWFIRVNMYI